MTLLHGRTTRAPGIAAAGWEGSENAEEVAGWEEE